LASVNAPILVTGSTGLLGSHLLVQLAREGNQIKAVYRDENSISDVKNLFRFYQVEDSWDAVLWMKGNIEDSDSILDLMDGVTQVYHCAALVSFNPADASKLFKVNIKGTRNLVNIALEKGVSKFVYVSSTAALGRSSHHGFIDENSSWVDSPENTFYAKSKFSAEREVWRAAEEGLPVAIVNPCVLIGPGSLNRSSGTMFAQVLNGLNYFSKGGNAFVDVRDVSNIMIKLMLSNSVNERFLAIGENMSFKDILTIIAVKSNKKPPGKPISKTLLNLAWRLEKIRSLITGTPPRITSETARAAQRTSKYSNKKIKKTLNIEFTPIDEAIDNTLDWLRFNQLLT